MPASKRKSAGFLRKSKNFYRGVKKGARKTARGAKKAAQVGLAGAMLTAKVTNPFNVVKMGVNAVRGKGLVLPGTRYIGPGNSLNAGKPKSSADAAAREHDEDYDRLLKKGVKSRKLYLGYSEADERLRKKSDVTTPDGLATWGVMSLKKGAQKLGFTGKKIKD